MFWSSQERNEENEGDNSESEHSETEQSALIEEAQSIVDHPVCFLVSDCQFLCGCLLAVVNLSYL